MIPEELSKALEGYGNGLDGQTRGVTPICAALNRRLRQICN